MGPGRFLLGVDLALVQKVGRLDLIPTLDESISAEEWLNGSLVIDFKEFGNDTDTQALAVALILNFRFRPVNPFFLVKRLRPIL
jgi:hypothetical protein